MEKDTLALIVSIVGASAWLAPYFYEKFKKAKLVGKVISCITLDDMTSTDNVSGELISAGVFYLYKLSVSSLGKNFHPKDVAINVTYQDGQSVVGKISVPRNITTNVNGVPHRIAPPRELLFPNICVFQKDKAQHVFMPFNVDRATKGIVEKVVFRFKDFNGYESEIEIDFKKIDNGQLMYEEILEPINS
ncbi:hypothetical protein [Vibrio lentus]|uniref:hypothetical protein n=1 Tax=Vibrio lentus TaxID=136468 RepID=UPI000C85E6F8|nr:hypothetical protein [Vibrio lentus]PMI89303.1 hypothetical protein BCU35_23245 [Vibrio lentus]